MKSEDRPGVLDLTPLFRPGVVSAKFGTLDGPFGDLRDVLVKVVRHGGAGDTIVKMARQPLPADASHVTLRWDLPDRGEYDHEIVAADRSVIAKAPFRVV